MKIKSRKINQYLRVKSTAECLFCPWACIVISVCQSDWMGATLQGQCPGPGVNPLSLIRHQSTFILNRFIQEWECYCFLIKVCNTAEMSGGPYIMHLLVCYKNYQLIDERVSHGRAWWVVFPPQLKCLSRAGQIQILRFTRQKSWKWIKQDNWRLILTVK